MEIFNLALKQMLLMFTLILVGFILRKKRILPENSENVMAKLEIFVFLPALSLYAQMTRCNVRSFKENASLILYGLVISLAGIAIAYLISGILVKKGNIYQRNIYKYALAFANFGYMGNFIVQGIWGNDGLYKYLLFTFFIGILGNGWGLYILMPPDENKSLLENFKKGVLSPPVIAIVVGAVIGLLDLTKYMPDFLLGALENAGNCQGPVAMILAGFVIGGYNLKELITNKKVYIATFLRLILIPFVMIVAMKLLGTNREVMTFALIAYATPIGLNTIVCPAAYGGETKTGASMTMISHTLSVVTIPIMYLLLIELL